MKIKGYSAGGRTEEKYPQPPQGNVNSVGGGNSNKLDLKDLLAVLGGLGVAIPAMKYEFGGGKNPPLDLEKDVDNNLGEFKGDSDVQMMAEGGVVKAGEEDDDDPAIIPEDIKEFVKDAHKERQESRPDESWRITPAEKPGAVDAPYKRDEEDMNEDATPGFAKGGVIPGYADGGGPDIDPNADLAQLAPEGTGVLTPPVDMPAPPPVQPPMSPPIRSTQTAPPMPPTPVAPPPTDQTYMDRANKVLGLGPDQQAGLMKLLGDKAQTSQIGAGIAGIGDAIASGGTLGKVNPGGLNKSEDMIQNKTKEGIEGMQTIRGNQEKAADMADKLEARDPNSPLSKYAQKTYGQLGKKIGLDLSHAPASMIADVTGKGVDALNTEFNGQLKTMGVQLQKQTLDATIANQKAEREAAKATNVQGAAKALADKGAIKSLVDMIPGTAGHAANKVLERQARGESTGPYGAETVRDGKNYEWSPETGKYHLKQ